MVDKKRLISCWAELFSKNCCWQAGVYCKKEVWNAVPTPNIKENWFAYKYFQTGSSCFT